MVLRWEGAGAPQPPVFTQKAVFTLQPYVITTVILPSGYAYLQCFPSTTLRYAFGQYDLTQYNK